jgi:hypothetical protein
MIADTESANTAETFAESSCDEINFFNKSSLLYQALTCVAKNP